MYALIGLLQTSIYDTVMPFFLSDFELQCGMSFGLGLVLNGQHLLQLAADGDGRIKIEGDVELEVKPLRPYHR